MRLPNRHNNLSAVEGHTTARKIVLPKTVRFNKFIRI